MFTARFAERDSANEIRGRVQTIAKMTCVRQSSSANGAAHSDF
jgi:hypothetical protein